MKRNLTVIAAVALLLAPFARITRPEQKKTDFSGTWVLQKSKVERSAPGAGGSRGGMGRGGTRRGRGTGGGGGYPGGARGSGQTGGGDRAGKPVVDSALVIQQTETDLTVTHRIKNGNGAERELVQVFKLDGSESSNPAIPGGGNLRSRTSWDKNKLVTLGTQQPSTGDNAARLDVVVKEEYSLSKDGKTLTVKTVRTRGVQIANMETFVRQR